MRWGDTCARWLLAALSFSLVLNAGCRRSVVQLGELQRDAAPRPAADAGSAEAAPGPDAQAPEGEPVEEMVSGGPPASAAPAAQGGPGNAGDELPAPRSTTAGTGGKPAADGGTGGTGGTGGSAAAGSSAGGAAAGDGSRAAATPRLPISEGPCPSLSSGMRRFVDVDVQLWVGARASGQRGPLLIYWHGTGSSAQEASTMLHDAFDDILESGGIIAAPVSTSGRGRSAGADTWYDGDLEVVDRIVACATAEQAIDPARIYTAGCSWGAVQAGALALQRSEYVAAAMLNSGGLVDSLSPSEPSHVPAIIAAHGALRTDVVIVNFSEASERLTATIAAQGGFAVDCDHGGGHCGASAELVRAQWEFLKAHPYFAQPSPYSDGLPESFPEICQISR